MGGKAFEGKTRRIKREEVPATLDWLSKNWKGAALQEGSLEDHLLGSAGKNDDSGDLDLNLRIEVYDQAEVATRMVELLGEDAVKARPGNNQIFTAVPIGGDPAKGHVQVDFMFGDYRWQEFSYFSAPRAKLSYPRWGQSTATAFKGLYRTEFLKALTAYNSTWVLKEGNKVVARVGPTFFHDKGCVWRYRHRPMRQDGTARVQTFKELSRDEFLDLYPSAIPADRDPIINPKEFVGFVLDPAYKVADVTTLEIISHRYRRIYQSDQRKVVEQIFTERLNNLKVDLETTNMSCIYLTVK